MALAINRFNNSNFKSYVVNAVNALKSNLVRTIKVRLASWDIMKVWGDCKLQVGFLKKVRSERTLTVAVIKIASKINKFHYCSISDPNPNP